jgi:hypothetical protein
MGTLLKNRVLRRIFGPKRDEVTGEWRRLHDEELNGLYSSPNIIWVIKVGGPCSTYGGGERCIQDFGEGPMTYGASTPWGLLGSYLHHCNKLYISPVLRMSYKNVTLFHLIASLGEFI